MKYLFAFVCLTMFSALLVAGESTVLRSAPLASERLVRMGYESARSFKKSLSLGSEFMDSFNENSGRIGKGGTSAFTIPSDRMLVHTGDVRLAAPKDQGAQVASRIETMVVEEGGYVENKSSRPGRSSYSEPSFSLTIRIPSHKFQAFLSKLQGSSLYTVTSLSTQSRDVTDSFVDATTRAETLQASIQSLQTLMAKADTVEAVLQVQKELNGLTQEYESNKARAQSLQKQATLSTLDISIQETQDEFVPKSGASNLLATLRRACSDVSDMSSFLLNLLVYAAVVSFALTIPLWLGYLAYRASACSKASKGNRGPVLAGL